MKKLIFLVVVFGCFQWGTAQGFGGAISAGYLSEIESIGVTADLIYDITPKFGVATDATYTVKEIGSNRVKWFIIDLNGHYKVVDELYLLAGGSYLHETFKALGLGGGSIGDSGTSSGSDIGVNLGSGYKYNLIDNVNLFAEVKYVLMDAGYLHARAGIMFDF